jgi:hypothetical protein
MGQSAHDETGVSGLIPVSRSLHRCIIALQCIAMRCNAVQCTRVRVRAIVQRCNALYRVGSVVERAGTVPRDAWNVLRSRAARLCEILTF